MRDSISPRTVFKKPTKNHGVKKSIPPEVESVDDASLINTDKVSIREVINYAYLLLIVFF
jgi:hypothetical protein